MSKKKISTDDEFFLHEALDRVHIILEMVDEFLLGASALRGGSSD